LATGAGLLDIELLAGPGPVVTSVESTETLPAGSVGYVDPGCEHSAESLQASFLA